MKDEERLPMRHFVQYRNPDTTGTPDPRRDAFHVYTNKVIRARPGDTIWVVTGKGTPRTYFLLYRFIMEGCGPAPDRRYRYRVHGTIGQRFADPPLPLNAYPWWEAFRRGQGNFAFGLNALKPGDVANLEAVAHSYTKDLEGAR